MKTKMFPPGMRKTFSILWICLFSCVTADFRSAEEMLREQKYYNAIELYLSFVREHPEHRRAPEALLQVANIHMTMLNDPKKALSTYQALVAKYPVNKFTLRGQQKIAELQ